jgi:hypothetical protein
MGVRQRLGLIGRRGVLPLDLLLEQREDKDGIPVVANRS